MKMWMVNLSKNLLPCNFQSLGLQYEQLWFGPRAKRCDGPVLRGKGGEGELRRSHFQRASFLGLGFSSAGGLGTGKKKKEEEEEKRKPRVEAGEVERTPLLTTPELDLREGLQGEECAVPFWMCIVILSLLYVRVTVLSFATTTYGFHKCRHAEVHLSG